MIVGIHNPLIHTIAITFAWFRLYGAPRDLRIYVAFLVHDLGYLGKSGMDTVEGKMHPRLGASIMGKLFGPEWHDFVLYHSRHYAKMMGHEPSRLCGPDKLASTLYPAWLYLTLATLSGEIVEYMRPENCKTLQERTGIRVVDKKSWFAALKIYLKAEALRCSTT